MREETFGRGRRVRTRTASQRGGRCQPTAATKELDARGHGTLPVQRGPPLATITAASAGAVEPIVCTGVMAMDPFAVA